VGERWSVERAEAMQSTEQVFDLFVIGGGSGGVRAARMAAGLGAKVGLCEEREMGGTCVNVGCVPKKLLVYGAGYGEAFAEAKAYGWDVAVGGHDWGALIEAKDREIGRLNGIYNKLLVDAGGGGDRGEGGAGGARRGGDRGAGGEGEADLGGDGGVADRAAGAGEGAGDHVE
jgi:hypothetical protein